MNRLLTCIALSAALAFTQSCSSRVDSQQPDPHAGHSMNNPDPHAGHHMGESQNSETENFAIAKLTSPASIVPNKPVRLVINLEDKTGKAIAKFDKFQEKLMHLIVVSDNLEFFDHLHPEYKENGQFEVEAIFPNSGNYTLFSDYKPTNQKEQVSILKTQVTGKTNITPASVNLTRSKTTANTKVNLTSSQPTLKAGKEVTLMFDLRDSSSNQSIKDLKPYLGEKGHLVIIRQSPSPTATDYIHAHALKDTPEGMVHFMTQFPQPGNYKVWGQFNRNGKIVTADFWVNVI